MFKSCPGSVDVTDLQFKLQCRLNIFKNQDVHTFTSNSSLLTCASRYSLFFVGTLSSSFQVIQTPNFYKYSPKDKAVSDYPRREIKLPSSPKHLCVNCDSAILAVVIEKESCPVVIFYDVLSFLKQNVVVIKEARLSASPGTYVTEINWNPSLPQIFTACKSDGTLGVYELKGDSIDINELPAAAKATCFCWSPKGKQIAVGSQDGKITQYKPDLKAVKVINEPKFENPVRILSLQWVSNYQFIGVYETIADNSECHLIVVDAPKTGDISYTNYDDICYSGSARMSQFYLILQQNWNFLMVASANSTEVGILGNTGDIWNQWNLLDTARAELPLSTKQDDTFPVGLTFDVSSTTPLPWGESSIPPCPLLCMLSHEGILCCFNVVNFKEGIPLVCTPPDPVQDVSGLNCFVSTDVVEPPQINKAEFNIVPQSTPLMSNKALEGVSKALFGGQTTLTPIKIQQPVSSSPLFSVQTMMTPKNAPSTTQPAFGEKYSSIFASLNPTTTTQSTVSVPVKPIVISAQPQPEHVVAQTPDPSESEEEKHNLEGETRKMLTQMISDELTYLEMELAILLKQGRTSNVTVGNDREKIDMVEEIDILQEFVKEAVDISVGQSSEIHGLKQHLIQAWAWFEEARSHYTSSKNEAVALILKQQPLDSVSQKRLKDIEQLNYYIESQVSQASKTLDEQWDSFQDYVKKTHRVRMPTMEAIFQTMVRQSAVLQKQAYVLKDISMRIKKRTPGGSSLLLSLNKMEDLTDDLKALHLDPQDVLELQYEKIKSHEKILSSSQADNVRKFLREKKVSRVTAVKPQLSSWAISQSPASRLRMTPKTQVVKNLNFNLTPFGKKEEVSAPPSGFVSSQGSAFAPTGFTALTPKTTTVSSPKTPLAKPFIVSTTISDSLGIKSESLHLAFKPTTTEAIATLPSKSFFGSVATTTTAQPIKPFAQQVSSIPSQSPQSFFASKANTTAVVTTATGVASIFATLQSVIDKATSFTPTASETTSKSNTNFTSAVTTTQSLFGSLSSTTTSKFGTSTVSTAGPLFKTTASNVSLFGSPKPTQLAVSETSTVESTNTKESSATVTFSASPSVTTVTPLNFGQTSLTTAASTFSIFGPTPQTSLATACSSNTSAASSLLTSNNSASHFGTPHTASNFRSAAAMTSAPNIFGSAGKSLFGTATATTVSGGNLFGTATATPSSTIAVTTATVSNIFGTATTTAITTGIAAVTTPSLFGTAATTTAAVTAASVSNLFGAATATTAIITTPSDNLFGAATSGLTTSSGGNVFGTATAKTTGSAAATTASLFGTATSTTAGTASGSLFGIPAKAITEDPTVTTATGNLFGTPATAKTEGPTVTTASGSLFGTPPTAKTEGPIVTTASYSPFQTPATTSVSSFGTSGLTSSIFGNPAVTTAASFGTPTTSNIFGAPSTPPSGFGTPTTTSSSIFGSAAPSTSSSIFGAPTTSSTSIFGATPAVTSSSNIFASSTSNQSPFGAQTGSIFGAPQTTSSSSVFGQPAASSLFGSGFSPGGSIFGSPATTTSSGSIFGGTAPTSTPVFGSSSFGTPTATTAASTFGFGDLNVGGSGGSIFGGSSSSAGGFAQAQANPFGKVGSTSSPFASSSSSNIFGTPTTTAQTASVFGSPAANAGTTGSIFGQPGTGNAFGSASTGFGSPSTFGSSTFSQKPTFGQPAGFGSTSFGSPQPGPFSGGASASPTAQSGFGAPASFAKPSGFGSAPAFGGSPTPAFGTAPSFGGAPAFGSVPTFGSPEKVFGSSQAASGGFGATATQQSTGFGNLASQNTVGFGNLAQQSNISTSLPFSGSSSFSSWR